MIPNNQDYEILEIPVQNSIYKISADPDLATTSNPYRCTNYV